MTVYEHPRVTRGEAYGRWATWLDAHIAALGYSNNQAAQLMHVAASTLWGWRSGARMPGPAHAQVISFALSVSVLEVLCYLFEVSDEDLMAELARRGV